MKMSLRNVVIQLADGKPLAFQGARGVHLECTAGRVWLTLEGQAGDFVLAEGGRLRIEGNGLALVEGAPTGAIRLVGAAHWAIRWVNRFNGIFGPLAAIIVSLARKLAERRGGGIDNDHDDYKAGSRCSSTSCTLATPLYSFTARR